MSSVGDQIRMDRLLNALRGKDVSNLTIIFGTCKECEHCYVISHTNNKVCEKHSCMQVSNNFCCADFKNRGGEE